MISGFSQLHWISSRNCTQNRMRELLNLELGEEVGAVGASHNSRSFWGSTYADTFQHLGVI